MYTHFGCAKWYSSMEQENSDYELNQYIVQWNKILTATDYFGFCGCLREGVEGFTEK